MLADSIMNTFGSVTVTLMFFFMSLAMYLYNTLLECSCCVMISVHLIV